MASDFYVATTGDDWSDGSLAQPFQTIRRALDAAAPGDTITLRGGVHQGGVNIDIDNLTIRSMPGEWAVIESPLTQLTDGRANSVLRYGFDVQGGRLENLEIVGGYYYGVMFWDWWDSTWDAGTTHVGASNITIDGCKIHDTGVDAVKITPGANDISILNSEIYNSGRRTQSSADGIDNNNGDRMIARGNYIHDLPGIGIVTSGGTEDSLVEQNLIQETAGAGIVVGFYSEAEWMEPAENPDYFTSINTIARNNIIVEAGQAGIGIYASQNPQVYNNTIVNVAESAQAPIQFGGVEIWLSDADPLHHVASVGPLVVNNIITTDPANDTRMVDIRQGSFTGELTLDHNLYHGTSTRGILFIDRNLTGDGTPEQTFLQWKANYGYDLESLLAEPQLGADWHLLASSPAIGRAIPLGGLTNDFDGNPRLGDPASLDLGADEFGAGQNLATPPAAFGAPSLEIGERGYHDYESQTIQVRVVRRGTTTDTVTVQFATLAGTAKSGQDFTPAAGTLTFVPGETEKFVAVPLLADDLPEGDEHFLFTLANPTTDGSYPVRLGHQSSASMTIDDEETPITLHYRTLWVAGDGSDITGDGSEANPWKSLQHAADSVGPGDYVIVKPGQYWGLNMTTDGKPDARITFHALPGALIDEPNPENHQDGINLEGADYVTIEGFEIHDMPRAGLRSVNNTGVIFRGNITDHNGWWGILTGWSDKLLVENNVASRSQNEHGIYISNSSDDAIVRNNIVWGNNDSGIQFNADAYLEGDGIHSRNVIEGNVIFDNGLGGGAAINLDGFQDGIVQNNLLYDNHATGIVLYVGYAADSSTNNLVTNNTVVMAEDARWALLLGSGSAGNTITNNILLNKNPNRGSMTVEAGSLPALSDHNILQSLFQLDGYGGSFAQWQAFSGGEDSHSLVVPQANVLSVLDTLFVSPAVGDFHLASGSPAIDVGDPFHAPATDLFQHARPQGAGVDIGAFEAGSFLPAVQFEWPDTIGYEFIGMAEIAVVRTGDTEGTLTVGIASVDGTALAGVDYTAVSEQIVFLPSETRKTFRLFMNDDAAIEANETVKLKLNVVGDPTGLIPGDDATLHIVSDDAWRTGRLEFDAASVTFDEAAGAAIVTVRRIDGASGPASVSFATSLFTPPKQATWIKRHTDLLYPTDRDQPATAGDDFTTTTGVLNFADGETIKTIAIPLVNDAWYEADEAFVVGLSGPVVTSDAGVSQPGELGPQSQAKVRIHSDDAKQPGQFQFAAAQQSVGEGGGTVNVTIVRTGVGNVEAGVRLYVGGGAAQGGHAAAWQPSDFGAVPYQVTFAPGQMSQTLSIPLVDDVQVEDTEAFTLSMHSPTNDATLGSQSLTTVLIVDNESAFEWNNTGSFSVVENAGYATVTINRKGSTSTAASVGYSTYNQSAQAGSDYTAASGVVSFGPGESSKTVTIPITNDPLVEPNESFGVQLLNPTGGATLGSYVWGSVTIINDDVAAAPGQLSLVASSLQVNEGAGALLVTVQRTGGSDGTVTVAYSTSDGASGVSSSLTAWAGADYTSTKGTLTFAPGETVKTFSIPITNDTRIESNEVFTLSLKTPTGGATLGAVNKAVITIQENDSAFEFQSGNLTVSEGAGVAYITIVRKGSTLGAAAVDVALTGYSAGLGSDFSIPNPHVTFADGEATKTLTINLVDDALKEGTEWIGLTLKNPVGGVLGSSLWSYLYISDND